MPGAGGQDELALKVPLANIDGKEGERRVAQRLWRACGVAALKISDCMARRCSVNSATE